MNQIDYLRQMRALRNDQEPKRDLWPDIAENLAGTGNFAPHPAWSIAAGILLAAGLLFCQQYTLNQVRPATTPIATVWKPSDPRLSAAAIDLAAARQQLNLALAETPRAEYLHTLLARTRKQEQRLQQRALL